MWLSKIRMIWSIKLIDKQNNFPNNSFSSNIYFFTLQKIILRFICGYLLFNHYLMLGFIWILNATCIASIYFFHIRCYQKFIINSYYQFCLPSQHLLQANQNQAEPWLRTKHYETENSCQILMLQLHPPISAADSWENSYKNKSCSNATSKVFIRFLLLSTNRSIIE